MSLVPSFFSKLGNLSNELFAPKRSQKFNLANQFEHKHTSGDVTWKTNATLKGDSVTNGVKATYKHGKTCKVEAEAKTNGNLKAKVSTKSITDGLEVTVEANQKPAAKVGFEYGRDHFAVDGEVEYDNAANAVNLSAAGVVAYEGLALGGEVSVKNGLGEGEEAELSDFNFAVNYDYNADTAITLKTKNKADLLTASVHHTLTDATFGAQIDYNLDSAEFTGRIGGTYKIDNDSSLKAKINQTGEINAVYSHILSSRAKVAVSSNFKATDFGKDVQSHRLGFKLSLGDF